MAIQENTDLTTGTIEFSRTVQVTWENVLVFGMAVLVVISRLWMLGARVMSHDESLHVYYSWLLSTGRPFAHNPMMHGPLLFEATALMDWFFGASDFTSRLVPVILGGFIVVAVPRLLKPWLGKAGALATAALLVVSPFVNYYSRYIRHDIPAIAWTLLAIVAVFRYLETRKQPDLILLSAALALMFSTMEISFIYTAIIAGFLLVSMISRHGVSLKSFRGSAQFDLLVVIATLGAFFSSPIALPILNPLWTRATGGPFVDLKVLDTQGAEWASGRSGIQLWALLAVFGVLSTAVGLWWDRKRWPGLAGIFLAITVPLFTTFFANPSGLGTGFIGSLGYWLSQQAVARGGQPWYYYLIVIPLYEYLPLTAGFFASLFFIARYKMIGASQRTFVLFLMWWAGLIFVGLSLAGEKMPWLSTHIAVPFILLSGWWVGQLIEHAWKRRTAGRWETWGSQAALGLLAILAGLTVRTSIAANYVNYDYVTEFIDYAHGAPGVKQALEDIEAIAAHTGAGLNLKVAFDDEVSWPMTWYLRDYRSQAYYGADPNPQVLDAPVILAGPKNWGKVESILGTRYHRFEVERMWWPMEDYKNLTWERIRSAMTEPSMRAALWQIFWDRDYGKYAELTGQLLDSPTAWPLEQRMRIYVSKDVAAQMLGFSLGDAMLADAAATVDAYEDVQLEISAQQILGGVGLVAPRGLALAPDGSIYVADTGNSRIVRLNRSGEIIAAWGSRTPEGQIPPAPSTFMEPWGIALDAQGNVYVADTWNHRVQKFNPDGKFLLEWNTAGQSSETLAYLWGPRGIAVGRDGRVYVTDTGNKRVLAFDQNGKFLFQFGGSGEGSLDEPVGIAAGLDGRVYVADTWNMRVAVFSADGRFLTSWPVQGWTSGSLDNKPYIAVDAKGRVYITDPEAYRVIIFSSEGTPLAAFGKYGTAPDGLGLPVGIALDGGARAWVVDSAYNHLASFDVWR